MLQHSEDGIRAATVHTMPAIAEKRHNGVARLLALEMVTKLVLAEQHLTTTADAR